jgi:hypothetical protein
MSANPAHTSRTNYIVLLLGAILPIRLQLGYPHSYSPAYRELNGYELYAWQGFTGGISASQPQISYLATPTLASTVLTVDTCEDTDTNAANTPM